MGMKNALCLEVLEWFDETGQELVHRIPEEGSGDIKFGAQLTVRESQTAVFYYQGRALHAFPAGRHALRTENIPVLTRVLSLPWGLTSPLRAEVYFVNMKVFTNLKWGTREPVAFKDAELGLVRLRTFGIFNLRVVQPIRFVNRIVGTQGIYTSAEIGEYLNEIIVSRFNDYMGETMHSVLDLPSRYEEISGGLSRRLAPDFEDLGLALTALYVSSITPPPEVQQAIDDRSRLGVFDDMQRLMQMKAAMAVEAAASAGGAGAAGASGTVGLGVGMLVPGIMSGAFGGGGGGGARGATTTACAKCGTPVPPGANFCPACGAHLVIFATCAQCGATVSADAKFCSRCGQPVAAKPAPAHCAKCGRENLPGATFCNGCGEKLG